MHPLLKNFKFGKLILIIIIITFTACKKDDDSEKWVNATQDYARAEAYIAEVFKIVDEAAKNEPNVYKLATLDCANISLEADTPGVFPQTLVINFGEVNCIGSDGRRRRGIIRAVFNGRYSEPGSVVNILFDNFFINNYRFLNNLSLTNNGNIIQQQHHMNIPNLRINSPSGLAININGSRTFKMIAGESTQDASDDVFQVLGSFSGSVTNSSSLTATITDALVLDYGCRSYKSGLLNVNVGEEGVFNYGEGLCDDNATITIDGRPYFILLE